MKLPTIADYEKDHDKLLKSAQALQKSITKDLAGIADAHAEIGKLYREFDRLKKKLSKESKGEADDKKGITIIERILKDGAGEFKKLATAVAEVKKSDPDAKKLDTTAGTLVKDLDTQVRMLSKRKAPDLGKYQSLLRTAKKTQIFISGDLVKNHAGSVHPDREKKDFEKELNKFIGDIHDGKHRKSEDDDWMSGPLEKAKVAAALKALKTGQAKAEQALKQIEEKIRDGDKKREMPDIKVESKIMKIVLDKLKKMQSVYDKAMKKAPKNAVKEAEKVSETKADAKKVKELLTQLETVQTDLEKRYFRVLARKGVLEALLKKVGAGT